ncbi:MAG: hypothetical protein IJJ99_08000 [Oscillospiraceae bacterium]|nr:hypothetical protein [Oscillospiraceae bacterium]
MSIPFYFAIEENEETPQTGYRYAQLGFGFHEDGTPRLPNIIIPNAPAVIDDRWLPAAAPEPKALDRLAEACGNGCFLDFERPINEVSAVIVVGLKQRLRAKMTVPPALHELCPDADVQIPELLCNHWERYVRKIHAKYGNRWKLEIIPWKKAAQLTCKGTGNGYLQAAECSYRVEERIVTYCDTKASIRNKLAIAAQNGCQAAIALLREYKTID